MARLTASRLRELALQAHQSAIEEDGFQSFMSLLARRLNVGSAVIFTPLPEDRWRLQWFDCHLPLSSQGEYLAHWAAHDPVGKAWQARGLSLAGGTAHCADEFLPASQMRKTPYYQEFSRRFGMLDLATLVIGGTPGGIEPFTIMSLHRDHDRPAFGADERAALLALHPHLQLALRAHRAMVGMRQQRAGLEDSLNVLPSAVFVLGASMQILHANPAAQRMLDRGEAGCRPWPKLSRMASLDATGLQALMHFAEDGQSASLGLWLDRVAHRQFGSAQAIRLPAPLRNAWPQGVALLIVDFPDASGLQRTRLQEMAVRCSFTTQETQVLQMLAEGHSSAEAAQLLGIKMSTMRTHIRHLVEKSGESRLMDLIRVLGAGSQGV